MDLEEKIREILNNYDIKIEVTNKSIKFYIDNDVLIFRKLADRSLLDEFADNIIEYGLEQALYLLDAKIKRLIELYEKIEGVQWK